jgi:hypothetical protein
MPPGWYEVVAAIETPLSNSTLSLPNTVHPPLRGLQKSPAPKYRRLRGNSCAPTHDFAIPGRPRTHGG